MKPSVSGLHVITDSTSLISPVDQAICAATNGARVVQLRDKSLSDSSMAEIAREILKVISPYECLLVINDRVEVACEIGAHGLHIGQDDGDPIKVRKRIGPDMILGLSITNLKEFESSPLEVVDYLGVGPIKATKSKTDHAAPIGFDGLQKICARAAHPVVAIGGLVAEDVSYLRSAGASGIATIGAVSKSSNSADSVKNLVNLWSRYDR